MSTLLANRLSQPDMAGLSVEEIVFRLNAPDNTLPQVTTLKSTRIGPGTVMEALGPVAGASLLDTLTNLAPTNPPIKWALKIIDRGEFDVAVAGARTQIDDLATAGVMTVANATTLKALAEVTRHKSWAEHNNVIVNASTVIPILSNMTSSIWIPTGAQVPNTQYVVCQGGIYKPTDLVGCAYSVNESPIVSFTASHIIS